MIAPILLAVVGIAASVSAQSPAWGQCGGIGWTGSTTCVSGSTCVKQNDYYSQCIPGSSAPPTTTNAPPPTATAGTANYWFSFGDSYTDTGFQWTGTPPSDRNPLGNPAYPGRATTGGENWIALDTAKFNKSLIYTYNYAWGGATIDANLVQPWNPSIKSMTDQVNQFLSALGNKPSSAPWASSNAMFSFWIGINDIGGSYGNGGDRGAFSDRMIDAYFALVEKLELGQSASNRALQDSVITGYNSRLSARISTFKANHAGAIVISQANTYLYDSYAAFTKILNSPTSYGFKDATSVGTASNIFWG
ncbi:hypothetical protein VNI00_013320 [Paramarasmius palmivorus]|uniref:CBM1 domain-containing protein n=1 Tax=Paramarasmius palmivorus TaxID=297713 RepID=A0AAW0C125_9AGAR